MAGTENTPVFFASYARADTEYLPYREEMKRFVQDLSAKVAEDIGGIAHEDACFFDESSIETGTLWRNELTHGLKTVPVALAIYSPSYFTSKWCGKEFQVFLNRASGTTAEAHVPVGIVPVLWAKCTTMPASAQNIQYLHDRFPPEYKEVGLHQLMSLKVYSDQYKLSLNAIAESIVAMYRNSALPALPGLDIESIPSAWDESLAADPDSHKKGSIAKTCFVFVSRRGWDWQPYPEKRKIGAMAQQITGDLGLRYEEIPCDAQLPQKLKETRAKSVPTILFGDPESLLDGKYSRPMREYDDLYLLNCGTLVPWSADSKASDDEDPRWQNLTNNVVHQKTKVPPPNHEWRSIFSQDELELKTRTIIENIRLRLLQQILSDDRPATSNGNAGPAPSSVGVRKAEDQDLTDLAAAQGIRIASTPQIEGPTQ